MRLEKNDIIEADIDGWGYEGEGVAHIEGAAVFIRNALIGERVRAKIIFAKKNFYYAIIQSVIKSSPDRIAPPCPYFPKCGGCDLQHIKYISQLQLKEQTLSITLKKQIKQELALSAVVPSKSEYSYRNKLTLAVRGREASVGFFAKNSHRLVEIDNCLLQSFDAKKLIALFRSFMHENGLEGYDEMTHTGDVRHLSARLIDGVIICAVVTLRPLEEQLKALNRALAKEYANSYALYANLNDKTGNVIFGKSFSFIGGNGEKVSYGGYKISAHPAAFFQVNDEVAFRIYAHVQSECIGEGEATIINAYAGAGTLSLMLCKGAKKLYSIELNSEAHETAKALAKQNGADNIICINDDCKLAVPSISAKLKDEAFSVVLDPPRSGCAGEVISALIESMPEKIVYISCNPATLARDVALLEPFYSIKSITPYDMFPQTSNLEIVTVLCKRT